MICQQIIQMSSEGFIAVTFFGRFRQHREQLQPLYNRLMLIRIRSRELQQFVHCVIVGFGNQLGKMAVIR
ncbi:hypothetical protein D3C76_1635070 [compost metagenome]